MEQLTPKKLIGSVEANVTPLIELLRKKLKGDEIEFSNIYDSESEGYKNIFSYWLVSEWLADRIRDAGGCVANINGVYIWGRTEHSNALEFDGILEDVCNDCNEARRTNQQRYL